MYLVEHFLKKHREFLSKATLHLSGVSKSLVNSLEALYRDFWMIVIDKGILEEQKDIPVDQFANIRSDVIQQLKKNKGSLEEFTAVVLAVMVKEVIEVFKTIPESRKIFSFDNSSVQQLRKNNFDSIVVRGMDWLRLNMLEKTGENVFSELKSFIISVSESNLSGANNRVKWFLLAHKEALALLYTNLDLIREFGQVLQEMPLVEEDATERPAKKRLCVSKFFTPQKTENIDLICHEDEEEDTITTSESPLTVVTNTI